MHTVSRSPLPEPAMASIASCFMLNGKPLTDRLVEEVWDAGPMQWNYPKDGSEFHIRAQVAAHGKKRYWQAMLQCDPSPDAPRPREVFRLSRLEGLSFAEIGRLVVAVDLRVRGVDLHRPTGAESLAGPTVFAQQVEKAPRHFVDVVFGGRRRRARCERNAA